MAFVLGDLGTGTGRIYVNGGHEPICNADSISYASLRELSEEQMITEIMLVVEAINREAGEDSRVFLVRTGLFHESATMNSAFAAASEQGRFTSLILDQQMQAKYEFRSVESALRVSGDRRRLLAVGFMGRGSCQIGVASSMNNGTPVVRGLCLGGGGESRRNFVEQRRGELRGIAAFVADVVDPRLRDDSFGDCVVVLASGFRMSLPEDFRGSVAEATQMFDRALREAYQELAEAQTLDEGEESDMDFNCALTARFLLQAVSSVGGGSVQVVVAKWIGAYKLGWASGFALHEELEVTFGAQEAGA